MSVKPQKIHSDLLDELLGPVDPVEYERVRKEMLAMRPPETMDVLMTRIGFVQATPEELEASRCKAKPYLFK
jgi:hypothetical protein